MLGMSLQREKQNKWIALVSKFFLNNQTINLHSATWSLKLPPPHPLHAPPLFRFMPGDGDGDSEGDGDGDSDDHNDNNGDGDGDG